MGGLEGWILIAVLLVLSLLLGLAGIALFFAVGAWFVRRRKAKPSIATEETLIKAPAPAKSASKAAAVKAAPAAAPTPAPLTPANVMRGGSPAADAPRPSPLDATVNLPPPAPGFALPPPPPPFQGTSGGPPKPPPPMLGFFDEPGGGGEDAKTELFSRDAAKRYAAMLDDEEDEGHTELFSKDTMGDAASALLDDSDPGSPRPPAPGRVVAELKK